MTKLDWSRAGLPNPDPARRLPDIKQFAYQPRRPSISTASTAVLLERERQWARYIEHNVLSLADDFNRREIEDSEDRRAFCLEIYNNNKLISRKHSIAPDNTDLFCYNTLHRNPVLSVFIEIWCERSFFKAAFDIEPELLGHITPEWLDSFKWRSNRVVENRIKSLSSTQKIGVSNYIMASADSKQRQWRASFVYHLFQSGQAAPMLSLYDFSYRNDPLDVTRNW